MSGAACGIHIVGIDRNTATIAKAHQALYSEVKLKNITPEVKARYFTREASKQALRPDLKACITLKTANIFDPEFKNIGSFAYIF